MFVKKKKTLHLHVVHWYTQVRILVWMCFNKLFSLKRSNIFNIRMINTMEGHCQLVKCKPGPVLVLYTALANHSPFHCFTLIGSLEVRDEKTFLSFLFHTLRIMRDYEDASNIAW